jgi:Fur family ferric uptake transcriptional regulator
MIESSELFRKTLKAHGHSLTSVRQAVFSALENTEPITMRELLLKLPSVDRASVYRVINLFEELGIVRRLQIGWKYKLELSEAYSFHHHHIVCLSCGRVLPIRESPAIETAIHVLAAEYGFSSTEHQLEIQGVCQQCRQNNLAQHSTNQ